MPARNIYHNNFRNALVKDGWTVTHDPFRLKWGGKDMYVDLGAERILAAERSGKKIAVEIQSFTGASELNDIENAMGQYLVYRSVMTRIEPDRNLYLAVHKEVFLDIFEEPLGRLLIEDYSIPIIVFDFQNEVILKWIQ